MIAESRKGLNIQTSVTVGVPGQTTGCLLKDVRVGRSTYTGLHQIVIVLFRSDNLHQCCDRNEPLCGLTQL